MIVLTNPAPGIYEGRLCRWRDVPRVLLSLRVRGRCIRELDGFRCDVEERQPQSARETPLEQIPFTLRILTPLGQSLREIGPILEGPTGNGAILFGGLSNE